MVPRGFKSETGNNVELETEFPIIPSFFLQTYAKTREHEMLKRREALKEEDRRRKKDRRSIKEKEQEQREEGLAKELDHTNKGFAMLQKMGFKAGQ